MQKQGGTNKLFLSFTVFVIALCLTYVASNYIEKTRRANQSSKAKENKGVVFYKSVGQVGDIKDNQTTALNNKYTVEILATTSSDEAEALVAKLKARNIEAFYTPLQHQAMVVYRVRQGIFSDQHQAQLAAKELQKHGISGKVIRLD